MGQWFHGESALAGLDPCLIRRCPPGNADLQGGGWAREARLFPDFYDAAQTIGKAHGPASLVREGDTGGMSEV